MDFLLTTTLCSKAQSDTIYFSKTGDTVLYNAYPGITVKDSIFWTMYTLRYKGKGDSMEKLGEFDVLTHLGESPFPHVNPDTIRKYNLEFNGIRQDTNMHEAYFEFTIKDLKLISRKAYGNHKLYSSKATIIVKFKNRIIKKTTLNYMFVGEKQDIDPKRLCKITYWKKQNAEKYFIRYEIITKSFLTTVGVGSKESWRTEFAFY